MRAPALLLLLAACAQPPPVARAPERAESAEPVRIAATVSGTIHHAASGEAGFAGVTVKRGDSDCRTSEVIAETFADHRGRYSLDFQNANECVIVEASAAGARGAASALNRSATPKQRVELSVQLEKPEPLTRAGADAVVASLKAAVNDSDARAMYLVAQNFLLDHDEAPRVGMEHLRTVLGNIVNARLIEERPSDFVYELAGTTGATSRFGVQQYGGRRIASNPMMHYGWRASRFVATFARLVADNDAEKLARLLTPDDADYPVEKARAVIARHAVLANVTGGRGVFTGIDERTSTIRYRIDVRHPNGTPASVPIELGYGDGLLWLRE